MTNEKVDDEQTNSENPRDRPFWSLHRTEQRLLWITFAGGLGSIITGALIIGSAIAEVRAVLLTA